MHGTTNIKYEYKIHFATCYIFAISFTTYPTEHLKLLCNLIQNM